MLLKSTRLSTSSWVRGVSVGSTGWSVDKIVPVEGSGMNGVAIGFKVG